MYISTTVSLSLFLSFAHEGKNNDPQIRMCVETRRKYKNRIIFETREKREKISTSRSRVDGGPKKKRDLFFSFLLQFFFSLTLPTWKTLALLCVWWRKSPLSCEKKRTRGVRGRLCVPPRRGRERRERENPFFFFFFLTSKRSVGEKKILFAIFRRA